MNHVVIMAGGVGSRFWPMSTEETPKQFIDVLGVGRSLIQLTYDRFKGICEDDNVWVVTSASYKNLVHEQLPEIPETNILCEPCRRNTAPCIAYVSYRIYSKDKGANICVTPSDAVVINVPEFRRIISAALEFSGVSDGIVTLGMKPTRPETGYGYIQANLSMPSMRNKEIFPVEQFREKPDLETAREYISHKNFLWNAGIFVWSVHTIINALRMYQPLLSRVFEDLLPVYGTEKEQQMIDERYPDCVSISIDYAVMEKAEEIYVMPADFGWSDLGTWGSLQSFSRRDANGNCVLSHNVKTYDTANCIINVEGNIRTVVQGLDGYIVAQRDGRLLICKLSEEQRITEFSK